MIQANPKYSDMKIFEYDFYYNAIINTKIFKLADIITDDLRNKQGYNSSVCTPVAIVIQPIDFQAFSTTPQNYMSPQLIPPNSVTIMGFISNTPTSKNITLATLNGAGNYVAQGFTTNSPITTFYLNVQDFSSYSDNWTVQIYNENQGLIVLDRHTGHIKFSEIVVF